MNDRRRQENVLQSYDMTLAISMSLLEVMINLLRVDYLFIVQISYSGTFLLP